MNLGNSSLPITLGKPAFEKLARQASQTIEARYWSADLYREEISLKGELSKQPCFLWDLGVQLSSLAQASAVDPEYAKPLLKRASKSLDAYWSKDGPVPGYSVLPGLKEPDRFYDDDAWIALAMQEAYAATKDKVYLDRAEKALRFALSGEDLQLGGGVYWREREKHSKNTCSNAPTALASLVQADLTGEKSWNDRGLAILSWTEALQDSDGLFFDSIDLHGKLDRTKWTYNTALMIRAWCHLAERGDRAAKAKAIHSGKGALAHWVDLSGAIKDEGSFAHHMVDAFLALAAIDRSGPWLQAASQATEFCAASTRTSDDLFGLRWDRKPGKETGQFKLLYQAAAARALWSMARQSMIKN